MARKKEYRLEYYDASGTLQVEHIESTTIERAKKKALNQVFGRLRAFFLIDDETSVKYKMSIFDLIDSKGKQGASNGSK